MNGKWVLVGYFKEFAGEEGAEKTFFSFFTSKILILNFGTICVVWKTIFRIVIFKETS